MVKVILFEIFNSGIEKVNRYRESGSGARSTALLATYHATLEREAPPYRLESRGRSVAYHPSSFAHAFLRAVSNENEWDKERRVSSRRTREQACTMEKEGEGGKQKERRILCVSDTLRSCAFETSDARPAALRRAVFLHRTESRFVRDNKTIVPSLPFHSLKGTGSEWWWWWRWW